jgi:type IV pilus biogenesis protein CpaD/CtpE
VLQRNVRLRYQPGMAADEAVGTVPASGISADDCRGRAGRLTQDFWPGDDDRGALLLPPGCATATILAAQATAPADLIRGRTLPPGAALPYAQAIERYYRRNDQASAKTASEPQEAGGEGASPAGSASGAAAAGANPLLGGVPLGPGH